MVSCLDVVKQRLFLVTAGLWKWKNNINNVMGVVSAINDVTAIVLSVLHHVMSL